METSRAGKSIKNSFAALCEQVIYTVLSFICRTVFIHTLGKYYLGFSGLFSDILTLLSLADLGMGTAILYSMYKPVAKDDHKHIAALLNLYKRFYYRIGFSITVIGICLIPFLKYLITDIPDLPELNIIYLLYLLNTSASYFFSYKKSILISYQKNYINSIIYISTIVLQNILQIIFLIYTKQFVIYLIIQILCTLLNNILISLYVDKNFTYLKKYKKEKIENAEKKKIFQNIKSLFVSKVSSAVVTSTDNILISAFVSTVTLGIYSNYTMFTTMLRSVISKIFESITGSVGNIIVVESKESVYQTFKKVWFANFWIVSFSSIALFSLVNDFIKLWIGSDYLLDNNIVFLICINLYMRFIRNSFITFNEAYGHFQELKTKCIIEAIINLLVSLLLVGPFKLGIYGILLGTFISNIATNFWFEPKILFSKFNVNIKYYYISFGKYLFTTLLMFVFCYYTFNFFITPEGWGVFFFKTIILCVGINTIYFVLFSKTEELNYFTSLIKRKFHKTHL